MAASGDHADAGLSRVSVLKNQKLGVIKTPGVSLIPVVDFFDDRVPGQSAYSPWYTRALTMQGHLLSTRKLIFSANQVYWNCAQSNWQLRLWNMILIEFCLLSLDLRKMIIKCMFCLQRYFVTLARSTVH